MAGRLTRTPYDRTVRFIPVKDGDVIDLGDSGMPGISGAHKLMGFKPGPGSRPTGWIVVLVDETRPTATKPIKRQSKVAAPRAIRRAPLDEKARLVREIRGYLPFIEDKHPDLAAKLREGMDAVENAS